MNERELNPPEDSIPEQLIEQVKEEVREDALDSPTLLTDVIDSLPHEDDGLDIIMANLRNLLTGNLTDDQVKEIRIATAIELEAMAERYLDRTEEWELKMRGIS